MATDGPTLQELIARTARGDHAAFAQVYERTHAHLFGLAFRMLGHDHAAQDVLQEAFVSIWKSASLYRRDIDGQEVQPMTWLIAIVRNKALDALRTRTRRRETELPDADAPGEGIAADVHDGPSNALELFDRASDALRIEACLGALDGSHRQSLALAYYQGLTHTEVAAQMGAPLGSVKAWIRRGLEKLKACLVAQGLAL
ncbi:MAG: sigma-70 family RNA polymerase sigma factor [Ramlibacter sp.]